MADKLTLRGVKRIEEYTEPADVSNRVFSIKRPTTGKDQFTLKRWWTEQGSREPKRYVNCTCLNTTISGTAYVLAVVSNQDTRLRINLDGTTLTFGETHSVQRMGLFSADLATLYTDYIVPKIPGTDVAAKSITALPAGPAIGTLTLTGVPATANGGIATAALGFTESGGTANTGNYSYAWTGTGTPTFSAATAATTTATWPAGTTGNQTVTLTITSSEAGITNSPQPVTSGNIAVTATGGIGTIGSLATTTAFTASQTDEACTLSAPALGGTTATATYTSDGSGDLTAVTITGAGSTYKVGDTVTVTEDAGTPGVGTFEITGLA